VPTLAQKWLPETSALLRLAWPTMLTQLGMMFLGIVDTLMLGHASVDALAAGAMGNAYLWIGLMFAMGVVIGIDPLVSQAHGAGDMEEVGRVLQRGIVAALLISVPVVLSLIWSEEVLLALGQSPRLAHDAERFLIAQSWSVPFFTVQAALRQYLQGRSILAPALWSILLANVLNVVFNWALIWGHLGLPALGLFGAGLATALSRIVACLVLLAIILKTGLLEGAWVPWSWQTFERKAFMRVWELGLPVGFQFALEVTAFSMAAVMAGWVGERAVAAHIICLNVATLTFMMPLGISIAAASRVGNLIGEGRPEAARLSAKLAVAAGALVMAVSAAALMLGRNIIPAWFSTEADVAMAAAALIPIAGVFQICDGTQVVCTGVLRGIGRTRAPAIVHFVSYYVIALPACYLFGFKLHFALPGIWWGLVCGLTTLAALLLSWLLITLRGPLLRV
jgi:multidrug resistance protein, MATE family